MEFVDKIQMPCNFNLQIELAGCFKIFTGLVSFVSIMIQVSQSLEVFVLGSQMVLFFEKLVSTLFHHRSCFENFRSLG